MPRTNDLGTAGLIALALVFGQWDGSAGDAVPQKVWDSLYHDGLLANRFPDQTGERYPLVTSAGYEALVDGIRSA